MSLASCRDRVGRNKLRARVPQGNACTIHAIFLIGMPSPFIAWLTFIHLHTAPPRFRQAWAFLT